MDIGTLGTGIAILCGICFLLGILFDVWMRNDKAEKKPVRVVESDPRTWDELQVSIEQAQKESW